MLVENDSRTKQWRRVVVRSTFAGLVVLSVAVDAARAAPVTVDVSFSGTDQTANWSQSILPASSLTASFEGIASGFPYVLDPDPQTDPVVHKGGTTFTSSSPISLTDDGMPIGGTGLPNPVTTQFTFDDLDWSLQDIQNLHVDLLNTTAIEGDWEQIPWEILIDGVVPGSIKLDFFHTTQDISFWQTGSPTIATDGSFAIPGTLRAAFSGTFELGRPIGSETVHGTGFQLLEVNPLGDLNFEIPYTLVGSIDTTSLGGPDPQDVLVELDGESSFLLPFDTIIDLDINLFPLFTASGSLTVMSTFDMMFAYHLETVIEDVHFVIPEPGSLSLLMLGLIGVAFYFRFVSGKLTPWRRVQPSQRE